MQRGKTRQCGGEVSDTQTTCDPSFFFFASHRSRDISQDYNVADIVGNAVKPMRVCRIRETKHESIDVLLIHVDIGVKTEESLHASDFRGLITVLQGSWPQMSKTNMFGTF